MTNIVVINYKTYYTPVVLFFATPYLFKTVVRKEVTAAKRGHFPEKIPSFEKIPWYE